MATADPFAQDAYGVRFEWGHEGARRLGASCAAVVVVDVLSFTTAVSVAAERGVVVLPWAGDGAGAATLARDRGALLAGSRLDAGPSLSPASMFALEGGTRLVLPSPNGSTCCALAAAGGARVAAGSLRNRRAVAAWLEKARRTGAVGVVAAGEQWPSGALRPALEDVVGAGAILALLEPDGHSPEARVAAAVYAGMVGGLAGAIRDSGSGRELAERGLEDDVRLAVQLDATDRVPELRDGVFVSEDQAAAWSAP